jgi:hypothetical protein
MISGPVFSASLCLCGSYLILFNPVFHPRHPRATASILPHSIIATR